MWSINIKRDMNSILPLRCSSTLKTWGKIFLSNMNLQKYHVPTSNSSAFPSPDSDCLPIAWLFSFPVHHGDRATSSPDLLIVHGHSHKASCPVSSWHRKVLPDSLTLYMITVKMNWDEERRRNVPFSDWQRPFCEGSHSLLRLGWCLWINTMLLD